MLYVFVLVLLRFGEGVAVQASSASSSCSRYGCDRHLLEKLVHLEVWKQQSDDKISDLETTIEGLENDLTQLGDNIGNLVDAAVSAATANAVIRPGVEFDGWELLYRATAGNGQSAYDAWLSGTGVTATKPTSMKRSTDPHYLDLNKQNDWATFAATPGAKVRYSLFKDELEVFYIVFDAAGQSYSGWFNEAQILDSSQPLMTPSETYNFFSIVGDATVLRRFFINLFYSGCPSDQGYTMITDFGTFPGNACPFDNEASKPQILYSNKNGPEIFGNSNYGLADYAAVYCKIDP